MLLFKIAYHIIDICCTVTLYCIMYSYDHLPELWTRHHSQQNIISLVSILCSVILYPFVQIFLYKTIFIILSNAVMSVQQPTYVALCYQLLVCCKCYTFLITFFMSVLNLWLIECCEVDWFYSLILVYIFTIVIKCSNVVTWSNPSPLILKPTAFERKAVKTENAVICIHK